jgi:hypothetical protein
MTDNLMDEEILRRRKKHFKTTKELKKKSWNECEC